MCTGGTFPGAKERPERDADHSPPSSALELYLLSTKAPPLRVVGEFWFFVFFISMKNLFTFKNFIRNNIFLFYN
jgi:hypothetical protein